ncbi:hypothetical protein AB0O47_40105, partial [Streptomyces noursei]|uniref:hypothetical protein n=1 Tax=Streptomyces noursei TaxID=1971 RepID=UPI00344F982C
RRRAELDPAPLLPRAAPTAAGGLVLDVVTVGGTVEPQEYYLRTAQGALYRLPEVAHPWARAFVASHVHALHHGQKEGLLLPCTIEFGILNGQFLAAAKNPPPTLSV